jgi:DHA1 family bicyclomycin/chloramphenicol resistance-like MFS transporter
MLAGGRHATSHGALIAILIAVSALNPLSINIVVPSMPTIRIDLSTDFATIQYILSAYLVATAVAQLFLGPLSDRFGRRPVLIVGLGVFVAASIACAFVQSIGMLIAARLLQGAGGCAGIALGRAIVRDRYDREQSASVLAYVTMGFATAPMVAPVLGGVIDDNFGWRPIFALLAVVGTLTAIVTWFALPETRPVALPSTPRPSTLGSFAILSRIPAFWAYSLTSGFCTAVFFSFLGGTPFIASRMLGMSGTAFGVYFIFVALAFMVGNYISGRYSRRFGLSRMITAGNIILVLAVAGMAIAFALSWITPVSLFFPVYAVGLANGLSLPNSIAGSVSVKPELAGAASGFGGAMQIGFGALATVIIGLILGATDSALPLAMVMLVLAIAALACGLWSRTARGG